MSVESISGGFGAQQIQKGYLDAKRKPDPKGKTDKPEGITRSDQIEISEKAKEMMKQESLLLQGKEALQKSSEPEVRENIIQRAETRDMMGHYDRQDVLEKIVEYLMKRTESASLSVTDTENGDLISAAGNEIQSDKIDEINEKIKNGFYDRIDVLNTLAERLLG